VVRATVRLNCGRCLAEFICPLVSEFALTYTETDREQSRPPSRKKKELDADEVGLFISEEKKSTSRRDPGAGDSGLPCAGVPRRLQRALRTCGADLNQGTAGARRRPLRAPLRRWAGSNGAIVRSAVAMSTDPSLPVGRRFPFRSAWADLR